MHRALPADALSLVLTVPLPRRGPGGRAASHPTSQRCVLMYLMLHAGEPLHGITAAETMQMSDQAMYRSIKVLLDAGIVRVAKACYAAGKRARVLEIDWAALRAKADAAREMATCS